MANLIYRRIQTGPTTWLQYHWNTDLKKPFVNTITGSFPPEYEISYPNNSIIAVYQLSPTRVCTVSYASTWNPYDGVYYSKLYLMESVVIGSSGDQNNTLLYVKCNTLASPPTLEYAVFSQTTKEVTTFTYPLSLVPFCTPFAIGEDVVLSQSCLGTTLRRTYFDGIDDIEVVDTINSSICGYVAPAPDVIVTEVKRIKIDHSCYKNPVFLKWKISTGGWDQWLFHTTQTDNLITQDLGVHTKPVWDFTETNTGSKSLGKSAGNTLMLGADNLTNNQYDAIRHLMLSSQIYKIDTNGVVIAVNVKPGTFARETRNGLNSIEFEIILPELYTVKS